MSYTYVNNETKLKKVIDILATHEAEIKKYFLAGLAPRIAGLRGNNDKLEKLFVIANADRQFTGKGNKGLIEAVNGFHQGLGKTIQQCDSAKPREVHAHFLEWLCNDISGMGQKTANLFLKYAVTFQKDLGLNSLPWNSCKPYLHVPLDIWVMRLLSEDYLGVCGENYKQDFLKPPKDKNRKTGEDTLKNDYLSPNFGKLEYHSLQKDIAEVAALANQAPIILDGLWFVGNKYCSHHPLFCDICWLREEGCNNEGKWIPEPVPSPQEKKEEKKRNLRELNKTLAQLLREFKECQPANPEITDNDRNDFIKWRTAHPDDDPYNFVDWNKEHTESPDSE